MLKLLMSCSPYKEDSDTGDCDYILTTLSPEAIEQLRRLETGLCSLVLGLPLFFDAGIKLFWPNAVVYGEQLGGLLEGLAELADVYDRLEDLGYAAVPEDFTKIVDESGLLPVRDCSTLLEISPEQMFDAQGLRPVDSAHVRWLCDVEACGYVAETSLIALSEIAEAAKSPL